MADNGFSQQISVFVDALGPQASVALAQAGHETESQILVEQTARRDVAPGVAEAVDGVQGKPFEQVRPDGVIFMAFDYRAEIVKMCFDELRARSPVVSGAYRDAHFAMLDGTGLGALEVPTAAQVKDVSRIDLTNPLPYSRKLEVGVTEGGSPFVKQVDPHIFESAAEAVANEFDGLAKIYFDYVELEGAYVTKVSLAAGRSHRLGDRKASAKSRSIRYPAIVIKVL